LELVGIDILQERWPKKKKKEEEKKKESVKLKSQKIGGRYLTLAMRS